MRGGCYFICMKHLVICVNPFFDMIVSGKKTIESRWANKKIAPFGKLEVGDELIIKKSGEQIYFKSHVEAFEYYLLSPDIAEKIKKKYGKQIGIDKFADWEAAKNKKYLTLVWLGKVERLEGFKSPRSNGSGWIVLK